MDIWTSKSGPKLACFVHFDLEMCFAPQRRALFRHLNFQKWSEPGVLCTFWLGNVLRPTRAYTFSTAQLPKVVRSWRALYVLTWKCASRHNGVQFFISHLASWLRTHRFSEVTFRPSGAPNHWKLLYFEWSPPWHFGILIWHSIWQAFYLAFYLAFLFGILLWHSYLAFISGTLSGILSGISFGILSGGWGPAGNTWILAVEVRQGTLGVDGRGWGPAGNTWRGFSRLRSGREHWAWMVAVEVRQGTLGVDGRGWGPEEADGGGRRKSTDIKSNNPHLGGGEKHSESRLSYLFTRLHLLSSGFLHLLSSHFLRLFTPLLFHLCILSEVWLRNFLR